MIPTAPILNAPINIWLPPLQDFHYLSSLTVGKNGKVFALFVKSPSKVGRGGACRAGHAGH